MGLVPAFQTRWPAGNQRLDGGGIGANQVDGRLDRGGGHIEDQGPQGKVMGIFGIDAGDAVEVVRHRAFPVFWMGKNLPTALSIHHGKRLNCPVIDVNPQPECTTVRTVGVPAQTPFHIADRVAVYNCTMTGYACSYTIDAADGRFRGRFEVFDRAGREVAIGTDPDSHATQQQAWVSIRAIAQATVAGLG